MVPGIDFKLVDHGHDFGPVHQGFQMVGEEVADADGFDPSVPVELFHGFPGFPVELPVVVRMSGGHGPVDQVQVQIVHLEKLHGGVKCPQGTVVSLVRVPDFAGDEYFFPQQGAFTHGAAHRVFIAVQAGRVYQAVTRFQRVQDAADPGLVVRGQVRSVTDAGHRQPVVQTVRISGRSDGAHAFHEAPFAGARKEALLS